MNYSRRVGAWLCALPIRFVKACVCCGKLEMISVWLLFLKLLRATAGVKRTNGNELNEGNDSTTDQKETEKENLSEAVTMETSELLEVSNIIDYKMDPRDTEDKNYQLDDDDKECFHAYFSECLGTTMGNTPTADEHQGQGSSKNSDGADTSSQNIHFHENIMVKEAEEESHERESITSPESDTDLHTLGDEEDNDLSSDDTKDTKDVPQSLLEQEIREHVTLDDFTEPCHDLDRDDLSDCLQVEMAIISSDSDADEQWKSIFTSAIDRKEDGEFSGVEKQDVKPHDDPVQEGTVESNADPECGAQSSNILEQPESPTECELQDSSYDSSAQYHNLSKIPEDDEEHNHSASHNTKPMSASDLEKKVPQDYCVIQETKSKDVSTEHVDFSVARKQWQKMEEITKGQVQLPPLKQGMGHSSHTPGLYTPVRNMGQPKKDPESESLGLRDFQYTQFSPCSEDSGLDDTSYRSPYDDTETPIDREIREALEREESFRRERGMSRQSGVAQVKPRPATLHTGKFERGLRQEVEEKRRILDTREDRYRSQRSPGTRTPTFNIPVSPTSRGSTYHEMSANNVIILEPDHLNPRQPIRGGLLSPGSDRCHDWPSDMANVIILETSNLIIRSASEFCLSTACQETQESTFHNNPFFKLRSHSTQSLVDQEIKIVKQRDEELRRQRAQLYTKEKYDTVLVSPNLLDNFSYDRSGDFPSKSKSSPSSPSKVRKMDRSTLSCDHKSPEALSTGVRRKSARVQRWEAGLFANHDQD